MPNGALAYLRDRSRPIERSRVGHLRRHMMIYVMRMRYAVTANGACCAVGTNLINRRMAGHVMVPDETSDGAISCRQELI